MAYDYSKPGWMNPVTGKMENLENSFQQNTKPGTFQQMYNKDGMVSGGQYLDGNGMVTGNQQVKAPTISYGNSATVAAVNAPAATPASPTSNMNLSNSSAVLDAVRNSTQENRQRFNQVYDRINTQTNPYDMNGAEYQKSQNDAQAMVTRNYNGLQAQAQGNLAPQASGIRAALANNLSSRQVGDLNTAEAQVRADAIRGGTQFEQSRNSALAGLVNGDYSGTLAALSNLAMLPGQVAGQELDNAGSATRNEVAKIQLKSYAAQANMDEQTFQATLEAKKQELATAKQQGREAEWMSQNSWWLGPLKFVGNAAVGVASAVAGK